jgi:hypothetical protein
MVPMMILCSQQLGAISGSVGVKIAMMPVLTAIDSAKAGGPVQMQSVYRSVRREGRREVVNERVTR